MGQKQSLPVSLPIVSPACTSAERRRRGDELKEEEDATEPKRLDPGADLAIQTLFYCPATGGIVSHPLGACEQCKARHDIIWQLVYVCPNTGYRIDPPSRKPQHTCSSCFQAHEAVSKRVFVCPVTGAQIAHPKDTGGKCVKCSKPHHDHLPAPEREAPPLRPEGLAQP